MPCNMRRSAFGHSAALNPSKNKDHVLRFRASWSRTHVIKRGQESLQVPILEAIEIIACQLPVLIARNVVPFAVMNALKLESFQK